MDKVLHLIYEKVQESDFWTCTEETAQDLDSIDSIDYETLRLCPSKLEIQASNYFPVSVQGIVNATEFKRFSSM